MTSQNFGKRLSLSAFENAVHGINENSSVHEKAFFSPSRRKDLNLEYRTLKVIGLLPTMGKRKPAKDGGRVVYTFRCCD
jgi:hypothetical protein